MVGGFNEAKEPTEEVTAMVTEMKEAILTAAGVSGAASFTVVSMTSQVVAGTNYMVKVDVGDDHVHAKIYKPLPHTGNAPELKSES